MRRPGFFIRKWVRPQDLNAHGTLFGGTLLQWIDEEAAIYSIVQIGTQRLVTKFMSEISFEASAKQGDLIEIELLATRFGRTSVTVRAEARNMITRETILTIDQIVFVSLDEHGMPAPHGYSGLAYDCERVPQQPVLPA